MEAKPTLLVVTVLLDMVEVSELLVLMMMIMTTMRTSSNRILCVWMCVCAFPVGHFILMTRNRHTFPHATDWTNRQS